jgi:hypothetical protein
MTDFFINHTRKVIVRAEDDAAFNITKSLREVIRQHDWSIDDHIELANSDRISHTYGSKLLINERYMLTDWIHNSRFFLSTASNEYRLLMLDECVGPFGV